MSSLSPEQQHSSILMCPLLYIYGTNSQLKSSTHHLCFVLSIVCLITYLGILNISIIAIVYPMFSINYYKKKSSTHLVDNTSRNNGLFLFYLRSPKFQDQASICLLPNTFLHHNVLLHLDHIPKMVLSSASS